MGRYNDEDRTFFGAKGIYYVATGGKVVNSAAHAHNSYVHFFAEGGLVGFAVTAGFWCWVAWQLRGSREPLRIAAFLGVLFLLVISMTEHYMGGGAMLLVLSSIVGAAWNLPEPPLPELRSAVHGRVADLG
jgi:O-antigen ligase